MNRTYPIHWAVIAGIVAMSAGVAQAVVVLNDPLQGSTSGTRSGGNFVAGGWQVTAQYDAIYWHVGTYAKGAFQYDVVGLGSTCPGGTQVINELSEMYDYTFGGADLNYNGGYRDDPYKHFIRKQCYYPKENMLEILWQILPNYLEDDSSVLSWNAGTTYTFRNEWENVGGNSVHRVYRNGQLIITQTLAGNWNPAGQSVRIAASPRRFDEGAPIGAIYSNVIVEDLTNAIPGAPSITAPTSGETVNTTVAFVQWNGDSHTMYQVRACTQNNPDAGIAYDSQQTSSDANFAWTGTLSNNATYYAFVRLGSTAGWGPWSAGRTFTVNTGYTPPGADTIRLLGNSVVKNSGPFLGLGATYMQALRRCKYDRTRYTSDLAFLASKEIKYIRVLSMVGWYSAWLGKEIAPVTFTAHDGYVIQAWPDYWQQFRDMIDIAYDTYGLRTELTIFADAQLMPNKTDRINHMQNVLNNLVGREHKIMHLEVCNEAWQNGFPDAQGVADLREFCQYLTDRTSILVAISDSQGAGAPTVELYSGSTADIATEHFSRDLSLPEGGWHPVYDCWHLDLLSGVPPGSSNEPIGPGSSVNQETDPIKLVMAAAFAWGANLPFYVYHTEAGVFGNSTFEGSSGVGSYIYLDNIMPPDVASWVRNDGKETVSAFTSYSNGQANKWWMEVAGATNGCVRNTGKIKGGEFITFPIGILGGGLELESRRPMQFQVYNPLTGAVAYNLTKNPGDHFTLAQGPGAYIIKGFFTDVPVGGGFDTQVSVDLGNPDVQQGLTHLQVGDGDTIPFTIGGRSARANAAADDHYYYFDVNDGYVYQGNKPNQTFVVDYYDKNTGTLTLQYDSVAGGAYKTGPSVVLTNTNTWKTVTWQVTDAYFGNRENNGADFRINYSGLDFYLDVITVKATQNPFGGSARAIPGVIQAEDFDDGGPSVAYSDADTPNNGAQYRPTEQVDIEACTDTGGGYNVGWTSSGEWLEYTVNVATTGDYLIKLRLASAGAGGLMHLSLNGVNITNSEGIASTGGWQTWTTLLIPGVLITAGNNQILRLTVDAGDFNFNSIEFAFAGSDVVSEDLDVINTDDGMTFPGAGDGNTSAVSIGGHYCRQNVNPAADFYMYFAVYDSYAFQGNKNNATITFDYFDSGTGSYTLHYDGTPGAYTTGPSVTLTNTNTWKTGSFTISNAYFGNRQNNGADFRIFRGTGVAFYIDTVMVFSSTGPALPGQASNPSPANAATLVPITSSLSWTAGSGATSHDVNFGTANPPAFIQNQAGTSYTPPTMTPNTTYFWRIDEKNTAGTTTGVVWSFTTLPLPGAASAPNPANAATLVPITSSLSWTAGSNTSSHDVRFGTANPPPFIVNQAGTTYAPGTLSPNTVYFWRIDEKNSSGTTTGTVWSFTTLPVPGVASAPSPATAATNIDINTDLTWTAGSNASSHDVRFGTANPPPFIVNQAGTTYDPGAMSTNTTYFWRIDEKNSSGTTTGTVWSFTTRPAAGQATSPNPANGATSVSITATLSWTAGANTTSHDVRFGTANPPPFIQNQAGTTYNPGTLAGGTTYFWRIDEKNGTQTTTGVVWSFTTVALPGVATSPNPANGASNLYLTTTLSWTAGAGATSHDVRFGTANPPPFIQNQAGTTYNPGTLAGSTTYYWRIDEKNAGGTTTGTVWSFSTASQSPYGGTARTIPGTIQAEDYDLGAESAAYHDTTAGNFMGGYRSNDVDIEGCGDTGGGFNVGYLAAGEWLEYTVNITNTGDHTFKVRLASGAAGGTFNFALNGNFITGNKTVAATGGWQTYTTITVPSVYMAAGNNQILRFNMPTDGMNINKFDITYGGADAVHVDLDSTVFNDGMTHPVCCDGMTTGATIGGHNGRKNVSNTADRYMYFALYDIYAYQGNRPDVWITVEYYDSGTSTMTLQYDATSSAYKSASSVVLTNTNTWKTFSWHVTDGYFGNRQNSGADFRVYMSGTSAWYLDTVQTSLAQP